MSELQTVPQTEVLTPITEIAPVPANISSTALVLSDDAMTKMLRIADLMASGKTTIPKHLQGNEGDCFAVCMQAMQWGMNPFSVAQKTHIVNGTLGYEAQLVIAVLNSSPALSTRINFAWSEGNWQGVDGKSDKSDERWAQVWATLKGEAEPRLRRVSMADVGTVRNSPNWISDPRQQLAYLTAKRWGRLHAPDVILGVYTPDELQDGYDYGTGQPLHDITPRTTPAQIAQSAAKSAQPERTDDHKKIIAKLEQIAKEYGGEALATEWSRLTKEDRKAIGAAELNRLKSLAAAEVAKTSDDPAQAEGNAEEDAQREPGADDE
jgi:hypothetical protein